MTKDEASLKLEIIRLRAALRALIVVTDDTVRQLEENCPDLAEVGYWNRDMKDAYEKAKTYASKDREIPGIGRFLFPQ